MDRYLVGNIDGRQVMNLLLEARYDISRDEHEDFFTAYIASLERAFREHAVENEALIESLTAVYYEALESYR